MCRRRSLSGWSRSAIGLVAIAAALPFAGAAQADQLLTLAARTCPTYADIRANEARNNIQESLEDLGANTPYPPTAAMDPFIEASSQPNCTALAGWKFTLGTGYQGGRNGVVGPWGNLSTVTGAYPNEPGAANPVTTLPSIALLTPTGTAYDPAKTIQGAVTITLTEAQAAAAATGALWVMGGTPSEPVAEPATYAFGALRCGLDNLNGDNVEFVSYKQSTSHAFCFAYYVKPAPPSATIIVRKKLTAPEGEPLPTAQTVNFSGNVSYEPGSVPGNSDKNVFTVKGAVSETAIQAGQTTFVRAAGQNAPTWTFREDKAPDGSTFDGVECVKKLTPGSTVTQTPGSPEVSVRLAAGDVVTCTYTNEFRSDPGLYLRKVTLGGIGPFGFSITHGGVTRKQEIATEEEGIAAAAPRLDATKNATYEVSESVPRPTASGSWKLESVFCNARPIAPADPVHITIPDSGTQFCTFTNRFTPRGRITLRKVTLGATATTGFIISPAPATPGGPADLVQSATTTETGKAVTATGDDSSSLPLGQYYIRELAPVGDTPEGSWNLAAVVCNGVPTASEQGRSSVILDAAHPHADCTVTNQFVPGPEPSPPTPSPTPAPPVPTPVPGPQIGVAPATAASDPLADLVVTKRATPTRVILGERVRYSVVVRNRGPATARAVTLVERQAYGNRSLTLSASQGRCRGTPPRFCVIGRLAPGESATVTVTVRPRAVGRFRNVVATNTATQERTLVGKTAAATIVVQRRPRPNFTG